MANAPVASISVSPRRILAVVLAVILAAAIVTFPFEMWEDNRADEILVVQAPMSGNFSWHFTAGVKRQNYGSIHAYKKRAIYEFDIEKWEEFKDAQGKPYKKIVCCGIEVRFNDGAHGMILGSIQYDMPMDPKYMTMIHTKFSSQEAVQKQIIEKVTGKAVYFAGPLMSSRESYAEKRNDLIFYIEDQIQHGVYKTRQREARVRDPLSGQEKTMTITEIVIGKDGKPERQEDSVLTEYGIKSFNLAIKRLPYDNDVEAQIQQQQVIAMNQQTSVASAKNAEQRAITAEWEGKAKAAVAKWTQEEINAKDIAEAEKNKRVAELNAQAAEQYKRRQTLEGEGDAAKKRLVMEADGALADKLKAIVEIVKAQTEVLKGTDTSRFVPMITFGGSGQTPNAAASMQEMMQILTVDAARRLGVDLGVAGVGKTGGSRGQDAPTASVPSAPAGGRR